MDALSLIGKLARKLHTVADWVRSLLTVSSIGSQGLFMKLKDRHS